MENTCKYITIRGIKRLCTFKSKTTTSDNVNGVAYLIAMIKNKFMYNGCSIFVCSDLLSFFVRNILPQIKHTFILVSGMSVKQCPTEALCKEDFFKLMTNKYLIIWCSQNNSLNNHPKIMQIPLGIDYHSLYTNYEKWSKIIDGKEPLDQEKYLIDIVSKMKPFHERIRKIYVNFDKNNDRYGQRKDSLEKISNELTVVHLEKIKRTETWKKSCEYAFVLSPYGQGMDCHRTWEALILGCIPIIKSKELKTLYDNLPILNVSDWSDVTQELLDKTIEDFKERTFDYSKLTLDYWKNKVFG
jgi:hypothetical protein